MYNIYMQIAEKLKHKWNYIYVVVFHELHICC